MQMVLSGWSVLLCEAVAPGVCTEEWVSAPEELVDNDIEAPED